MSEVTTLKVNYCFEDAGYWVLDFIIKGGKRNRLAIHHELQRILLAYLAQSGHGAERESLRFLAAPRRERRKPLTRRQVSQRFHRYAREAGLPLGVTPHRARAAFITEALDRKCPIEAVPASVGGRGAGRRACKAARPASVPPACPSTLRIGAAEGWPRSVARPPARRRSRAPARATSPARMRTAAKLFGTVNFPVISG